VSNEVDTPIKYLTVGDVEAIHRDMMALAGLNSILRQRSALEGAVQRPRTVAYYGNSDLFMQAAHLTGGIATADAFEDGNKHLALVCALTFLRFNGIRITAPIGAIADQILAIVNRGPQTLGDASAACAAWLAAHAEAV
jgi:death on curing protein